ncbi:hypothetical protein HRI_000652900 [Hibiscus trionum]|uniref:Uncharacterized protein n=1 Tax=Hibiscus trionum TaxID=183268 RepID=A0A9W7H4I3_HIBTR|nr:hypothetical protein HRI_000652900 [Hibiscus trionum]
MENKNEVLDVSSFFLVEDSGDSELDRGPFMAMVAGAADEDNAKSSSCNDMITTERSLDDFYEVVHQHDDEEEDDQNFIDYGHRSIGNVGSIDEAIGSYNIFRNVMDCMEDRLFWETCLAVGYPMN